MKLKTCCIGIGWNHELNIPVMDDEWWDTYLKGNGNSKADKFRYQTLPNFDVLHRIYRGQVATGNYSQLSSGPVSQGGQDDEAQGGLQSGVDVEIQCTPIPMVEPTLNNRARIPIPRTLSKRKSTSSANTIASAIKTWEESTAAKRDSRILRNSIATGLGSQCHAPPPPNSDHEYCMEMLQSVSGVDVVAFARACESFSNVH